MNWFAIAGKGDTQIYRNMILSSVVLEAFGNAKTRRNHNSSRFGKFFKLQFSQNNAIAGGHIETFLLELARVTHRQEGDTSFHIFYQILAGLSVAEKR